MAAHIQKYAEICTYIGYTTIHGDMQTWNEKLSMHEGSGVIREVQLFNEIAQQLTVLVYMFPGVKMDHEL